MGENEATITLTDGDKETKYKIRLSTQPTEAEKLLLKAWNDADKKLKLSNENNNELKNRLDLLQTRLVALENELKSEKSKGENSRVFKDKTDSSTENTTDNTGYCTDDDLLAKETEWLRAKSRNKKRKLNTTLSPPTKEDNPTNNTSDPIPQKRKNPPLPPVIVDGIKSYNKFHEKLVKILPNREFKLKLLGEDSFKINLINVEDYRVLTKELNKENFTWHSYENKQIRPIRVMAKKLHRSCDSESIVEDLRNRGFKILNASIKLKWKTKDPLDMFMLEFDSGEEIDKIYKITNIMGCKVEIEAIRKSKLIAQCRRCQSFNHTQKYCYREFRCVKCAGKHSSKDCDKAADEKPKCIHCGEPHPASYRGCSIAVELQKIRNKSKNKTLPAQSNIHENRSKQPQPATSKSNGNTDANKHASYAAATRGLDNVLKSDGQKEDGVRQILQVILNKLDKQETLLSSFEKRLQTLEGSTILAGNRITH